MFGAGVTDWTLAPATVSETPNLAQLTGGAVVTFWSDEMSGVQYIDLLDADGAPVSDVLSADGTGVRAVGQIPPFQGPDGVTEMWASANGGPRALMVSRVDAVDRAGGTMSGPLILPDGSPAASEQYASTVATELADVPPQTTALRTWHYGLANRFYAPARIAAIGSSTTEGVGQTAHDRTYLARLRYALRTRYPVPGVVGGENYVASWGSPTYPWPVTRTAGVATDSDRGWGLKAVLLSATGHALTHTFVGTSVQVWYSQYAGGGTFSVEVDGVTVAAAVNTNGATDRNAKWVSAALSAGPHTIVVRYVSGSTVYVHGFASYNGDENAGINIYNGGLAGLQSGDILGDVLAWATRLATIQPHLVILQLGVNDYTGSVPSATMKANLKAGIAAVRANSPTNPSFVIFGSPRVSGGTYAEPFDNYVRAWKEIAAEDTGGYGGTSGVAYFNLGLRQPSPAEDNTAGLYQPDLTHSTDKGAAHIADTLATFLTPR